MMTLEHFQTGLDQWGSALDSWPHSEQQQARALVTISAEAQQLWATAQQITAAMQRMPTPSGSDALRRRLKTIPAHYAQPSRIPAAETTSKWTPGWWWGGGLVAASTGLLALGFLAGFTGLITLDSNLVDWAALAYGSL